MIEKISTILNSFSSKWACVLSNGTIAETTLEDKSLSKAKILRILKYIIKKSNVGSVVIFSDLVIYRPTADFFIFLIGQFPRNLIKDKFTEISSMYKDIDKKFKKKKKKSEVIEIELILFSLSTEIGPDPIFYIPQNYNEDIVHKVCMKSILSLSVESEGAKKDTIAYQPFVDLDSLGIINTFQIKDKKARGGAFDSALTILVDYKYRALVFENYTLIEKFLSETRRKLIKEYRSGKKEHKSLYSLRDALYEITFDSIETEDIKADMMEEIKKLAKL